MRKAYVEHKQNNTLLLSSLVHNNVWIAAVYTAVVDTGDILIIKKTSACEKTRSCQFGVRLGPVVHCSVMACRTAYMRDTQQPPTTNCSNTFDNCKAAGDRPTTALMMMVLHIKWLSSLYICRWGWLLRPGHLPIYPVELATTAVESACMYNRPAGGRLSAVQDVMTGPHQSVTLSAAFATDRLNSYLLCWTPPLGS